ncbi:MAG: hypothetical protein ACR2H1_06545, partial [Limisphaerales bacterium]
GCPRSKVDSFSPFLITINIEKLPNWQARVKENLKAGNEVVLEHFDNNFHGNKCYEMAKTHNRKFAGIKDKFIFRFSN